MEKQRIDRINELARAARERELTEAEKEERRLLREDYLKAFRGQMRAQLSNTVVEYPDGRRVALKDVARKPRSEAHDGK